MKTKTGMLNKETLLKWMDEHDTKGKASATIGFIVLAAMFFFAAYFLFY